MSRFKPENSPAEAYTLVEFDLNNNDVEAPMRDLIVCVPADSVALRGRILERFAERYDRRSLSVDACPTPRVAGQPTRFLEVRSYGYLAATVLATPLEVKSGGRNECPRCHQWPTFMLVAQDTTGAAPRGTFMTACRRCGWRTAVAEYDLGRTA